MSRQSTPGFTFKDKSSDDMNVRLMKYPDLPQPDRKGEYINVPGRDGELWVDQGGYKNITLDMECGTRPGADLGAIGEWLSGAGLLSLNADPILCYRARVVKGYLAARYLPGCDLSKFKVQFNCQPFRYQSTPEIITRTSGGMIPNPGNVYSEPIITVYGSGDINLLVGTSAVLITGLDTGSITLNCEAKVAYKPGDLTKPMNKYIVLMSDEWPRFDTGQVMIQWTGTVSKVVIEPQWRWR